MPATPAEVANDLFAQARYFAKRDDTVARLCTVAARLIRAKAAGELYDDRAYRDVEVALIKRVAERGGAPEREAQITKSLRRALETLQTLRTE